MTAPVKPLPPHSNVKDCPCPRCRLAKYRYNKQRELDALAGRPYTITAEDVAEHVRLLLAADASIQAIATAASSSHDTVQRILTDPGKPIWASTASRILAVTAADARDDYYLRVDGLIATRRVRALIAGGHTVTDISRACDPHVSHGTMTQLINGTLPRVRARTDKAVAIAYDLLGGVIGESVASRNRGLRKGWAPPSAWDGIDIGDPDAFPDFTGCCGTPNGARRHHEQGIPCCDPCRQARRAHGQKLYAARKAQEVAA